MLVNNDLRSWSVSNLFLVPLLNIGRPRLDKLGFINSYLYNSEEEDYPKNSIHLLFQPKSIEAFNDFILDERQAGNSIIDEKDYPGNLVMVTYSLPKRFEKDYKLIWEGRYSETSSAYQKSIPEVVKFVKKTGVSATDMTIQHMIFKKYEPLKRFWEEELDVVIGDDQELWTKPTIKTETFKLSDYECVTDNPEDTGGTIY
jgi:hypothetical protein